MGLAFMCAEKILGLFKKRVRPEKKCGSSKEEDVYGHVNVLPTTSGFKSKKDSSSKMRVYVPTCHPDRFTHESQPGYTDMMLGYPPTIQISLDGEEGYKRSQLLLHKTMDPSGEIARASIRPPPNKTIYDGDSPPPSRSQSVGLLNRHSGKPPSTRNLRQCGARSTERIGGCYSPGISNNNNYPSNSEFVSSRTCSSAGHSRNSSGSSGCSNTEAPPPYSDVIANIDDFTCRSGNV